MSHMGKLVARIRVTEAHAGGTAGSMSVPMRQKAGAIPARSLRATVLRGAAGVRQLRSVWRRLEREVAGDVQAFQTGEWNLAWVDVISRGNGDDRCMPLVVIVTDDGGAPVLLWPLMRERYPLGLKVISPLTDPYGQYADVLTVLEGRPLQEALDLALAALRRERVDLLRLRHVRDDASLAPFAREHFLSTGEDIGAPWLDLSPYATPEDLDRRYSRTQRRRRRRIRKKLEEHAGAPLVFRRVADREETCRHIGQALHHKRLWLQHKGRVSRALFRRETEDFLCRLAGASVSHEQGLELCLTVLEAGERALSWEIGLRYHGRHYAYITAHRPELTDLSVGRLHMDLSQKLAVMDGMKVFDLLVPNDAHKHSWSSHVEPVGNYYLPFTLRGAVGGHGYLRYMRPMVQRMYHALPEGMRQCLPGWKRLAGES